MFEFEFVFVFEFDLYFQLLDNVNIQRTNYVLDKLKIVEI